ncbi:unnamed protein product [Cutaneotrichosporon oleaginosum]
MPPTSTPTPMPSPDPRIGMWPWVGFLTLALSLALLTLVVGMVWMLGLARRRAQTDAERAETRALLVEAERVGSQFSRF